MAKSGALNSYFSDAKISLKRLARDAQSGDEDAIVRELSNMQQVYQKAYRTAKSNPELQEAVKTNAVIRFRAAVETLKAYRAKPDLVGIADNYVKTYLPKSSSPAAIAASILGIFGGLFCISPNLTGNAIGNMTTSNSTILGTMLLLVGIAGAFIYVKGKQKTR